LIKIDFMNHGEISSPSSGMVSIKLEKMVLMT
jgi:hypothetical protein